MRKLFSTTSVPRILFASAAFLALLCPYGGAQQEVNRAINIKRSIFTGGTGAEGIIFDSDRFEQPGGTIILPEFSTDAVAIGFWMKKLPISEGDTIYGNIDANNIVSYERSDPTSTYGEGDLFSVGLVQDRVIQNHGGVTYVPVRANYRGIKNTWENKNPTLTPSTGTMYWGVNGGAWCDWSVDLKERWLEGYPVKVEHLELVPPQLYQWGGKSTANRVTNPGNETSGGGGYGSANPFNGHPTGDDVYGWAEKEDPGGEAKAYRGWCHLNDVDPRTGSSVFSIDDGNTDEKMGECYQEIDVSAYATHIDNGQQTLEIGGWTRTYPDGFDTGQIIVEYRDGLNGEILAIDESEELSPVAQWEEIKFRRVVPPGTRYVRIRLISRKGPSGGDIDAAFDDIFLSAEDRIFDKDVGYKYTINLAANDGAKWVSRDVVINVSRDGDPSITHQYEEIYGEFRNRDDGTNTDNDWHYYLYVFAGDGSMYRYVDGQLDITSTGRPQLFSIGAGVGWIESFYVDSNADGGEPMPYQPALKMFSPYDLIVDDISVWDARSMGPDDFRSTMEEIHTNIYKYGAEQGEGMPAEGDSRLQYLVQHYTCSSAQTSPKYYQDDTFNMSWNTVFARQREPNVQAIDDPLRRYTRVISSSEFLDGQTLDGVTYDLNFTTDYDYGDDFVLEAPEFVYLDKDRNLMDDPTDAEIEDDAYYRGKCLGYTVNGGELQNNKLVFRRTLDKNVNITWHWETEYALVIDSATAAFEGLEKSLGNAEPRVGKHWVKKDELVSPEIDGFIEEISADGDGLRFASLGYDISFGGGSTTSVDWDAVDRLAIPEFVMSDYVEIEWRWRKEYTVALDVSDPRLVGLPYLSATDPTGQTYSLDTAGIIWLPANSRVTVGSEYFGYPDTDVYSLRNVHGQTGPMVDVTMSSVADGTHNGKATREYTFAYDGNPNDDDDNGLTGPGRLTWYYESTVYHAELLIGEELDVANTSAANARLTPDLPAGVDLLVSEEPELVSHVSKDEQGSGGADNYVAWDAVRGRVLPLQPGQYWLRFRARNNPEKHYTIELVAGMPTDTDVLTWDQPVDDDGYRISLARTVTWGELDDVYPASPTAHYNYLYSGDLNLQPPTSVDPNPNDRWFFQRQTYSTCNGNVNADTKVFTAGKEGRSVLLFSYRLDANEVGTGDIQKEAYAVRIVRTLDIDARQQSDTRLSSGARQEAVFDGSDGTALDVDTTVAIGTNTSQTLEFWCNLQDATDALEAGDDRILLEQTLADGHLLEVGFHPANDGVATDAFFVRTSSGAVTHYLVDGVGSSSLERWTHWAVVFGAIPKVYRNGMLFVRGDDEIVDVNSAQDWIKIFGERTGQFPVNKVFLIQGSTANDGTYTVATSTYDPVDDVTEITVQEGIASDTVDGAVTLAPWPTFSAAVSTTCLGRSSADTDGPADVPDADTVTGFAGHLDNLHIWDQALDVNAVRAVMLGDDAGGGATLLLNLTFDGDGGDDSTTVLSPFDGGSDIADIVRVASADGPAEVATRILSKLDTADYQSGYLINELSNYNALIYDREAVAGAWGPIYPVNWSGIYSANHLRLKVAYYENPNRDFHGSDTVLHPNVGWPYCVVSYGSVDYPTAGPHKDKRVYIASRVGSEGVDVNAVQQLIYDPVFYDELAIYNQPDRETPGFNPNEEHALVADSIRAQLIGGPSPNVPPKAAFALQNEINVANRGSASTYTSDPWVLVQYKVLDTGEWEMAAYKVESTREILDGTGEIEPDSVFPRLDSVTHLPTDALGQQVVQPANPSYLFDYSTFAGDPLVPPYPLNIAIGAVTLSQSAGANIVKDGVYQRTLWYDRNGNGWVVSGSGEFFYRYWYPLRSDFWYELSGKQLDVSTPIAWVPVNGAFLDEDGARGEARRVLYQSHWRDDYPKLKRGETLTYQGGENKADNSADEGLPAVVAMKSAQVVYDTQTREMALNSSNANFYTARVIRPLDRIEVPLALAKLPTPLSPANTENTMVVLERWYFRQLIGSLQKRFYYDSLLQKLVFRGRLNNLESGDRDLTATPVSLYVLEPNVMTLAEFNSIQKLGNSGNSSEWTQAISEVFLMSQNPHGMDTQGYGIANASLTTPVFYAGLEDDPEAGGGDIADAQPGYVDYDPVSDTYSTASDSGERIYRHLDSLGAGSALIPNPRLLSLDYSGPLYVTLAENNHPDATGAVSLHIVQVIQDRFRGAIKMIEAQDVFDEKINLQHNAEFGANTGKVYYQWWVRDADVLANVGLPGADVDWQVYKQGMGLHKISFTGRPDVVIADKLFYVRYGEKSEFESLGDNPAGGSVSDDSWRLVDFEGDTYSKFLAHSDQVPYQWAGASNSPQLQADGSKRYIPQLAMGWVKRVLDRVNPYEARFSDFLNNESAAVYSSMLQIAGKPYVGKVALNSDKDVIENVGLIELYETVLARASELTVAIPGAATPATNQALLLAATRLAEFYNILGMEAYSDAQDPTICVQPGDGLSEVATYTYAFQNQEASPLYEEIALLRGTDFLKAYPVYNRLMWNYVKGLGEAAYNSNYNIYDANEDGFINEYDAAELYPMGHGDAWGHFVSAGKMHYKLLRHSGFSWQSKSELYSLLDNVIEADYLDEQSFARIAAIKAKAGRQIVDDTYRLAYTEDPDGQWQGYTDIDEARAWGVSEWSKRTGQAALFDWVVANAIVPADADDAGGSDTENLDQIDRRANQAEIAGIAGSFLAIQNTLDGANAGLNPLGLDPDSLAFDLSPYEFDRDKTHFEQAYERAVAACRNAVAVARFASQADNKLRGIADATEDLQKEALKQDLDYRNRLIEVFGKPYDGLIGSGKPYPEGYQGPDVLLYMYLDQVDTDVLIPEAAKHYADYPVKFQKFAADHIDVDFGNSYTDETISDIFRDYYLFPGQGDDFAGLPGIAMTMQLPVVEASDYAFQADPEWGSRIAHGRIQDLLNEMLQQQIELEAAINEYNGYITTTEVQWQQFLDMVAVREKYTDVTNEYLGDVDSMRREARIMKKVALAITKTLDYLEFLPDAIAEAFPKVVGFSNDATSAGRSAVKLVGAIALKLAAETASFMEMREDDLLWNVDLKLEDLGFIQADLDVLNEFKGSVAALNVTLGDEYALRLDIAQKCQALRRTANALQTAMDGGFGLMSEREAFNMALAAKAQKNRYQDMVLRLGRNEALGKYQSAFRNAQRYVWLAAKAYDYETSLDPGDPAAATTILGDLVRTRTLGLWDKYADGDEPCIGQGGLAEVLAQLKANFTTLKGQLGINNPQQELSRLSLRYEYFRIAHDGASDERWRNALQRCRVENLWDVQAFRQHCRPFAVEDGTAQPGLVIRFGTEITAGKNAFGRPLGASDHAFSSANFATKIRSAGLLFDNYVEAGLSSTPRAYLVPVGHDVLRLANSTSVVRRSWNVVEQVIPAPFLINAANLTNPDFIPALDGINGAFAQIKRFGDMRAHGSLASDEPQYLDSRLIGRSVWNTSWLLIIPGIGLNADPERGLDQFVESVDDIRVVFCTYSHSGI